MNRKEKLFVVTTENGEMFHFLDEFVVDYIDRIDDGEEWEYEIEHWEAGHIMENNSLIKEWDADSYWNPLELWNDLQNQIAWQRRRGVVNFDSARQLIVQDVAEIRAYRLAQKNKENNNRLLNVE